MSGVLQPIPEAKPERIAERAWSLHCEVVRYITSINETFLDLGRVLRTIHDERLYVQLGYDTFESYIASPEVSLSRTLVYRLLRAVKIVESGLVPEETAQAIGVSKLDAIAPYIEKAPPDTVTEVLVEAQSLSYRDLNERLRERFRDEDALEAFRRELAERFRIISRLCRTTPDIVQFLEGLLEEIYRARERALWLRGESASQSTKH